MVNERFAHLHWPGRDPLGSRIALADGAGRFGVYATVIGVIGDVRHQGPANDPEPELYFAFDQRPQNSFYLAIRTAGDPAGFAHSLEQLVREADANLPVNLVRPMDRVMADRIAPARIATALLAIFSTLALLLAAMGLYGVISYLVVRRTREFGIRLALGASTRDLLALVLRRAFALTAIGTILGVLAGLAVSRVLSFAFEGVKPSAGVLVVTAAVLAGVALLATWPPLRRALSVGPMTALRSE